MSEKHTQEVLNLQQQVNHMNSMINQMIGKMYYLEETMKNKFKTICLDIVAVVTSPLESNKEKDYTNF